MLNSAEKSKLNNLLENDESVCNLLEGNTHITKLKDEISTLEAEVLSLAEYNLEQEKPFNEKLEELKLVEKVQQEKKEKLDDKIKEFVSKKSMVNPESVLNVLKVALSETEQTSEKIANNLRYKNIQVDQFLEDFYRERKLFHMRKVKTEKMAELLVPKSGSSYARY